MYPSEYGIIKATYMEQDQGLHGDGGPTRANRKGVAQHASACGSAWQQLALAAAAELHIYTAAAAGGMAAAAGLAATGPCPFGDRLMSCSSSAGGCYIDV